MSTVLAVDPGSAKCGVAVVCQSADGSLHTLHKAVVPQTDVETVVRELCDHFLPGVVLVGNATQSRAIRDRLQAALTGRVTVEAVDEAHTSRHARARYLRENPPQGRHWWQRLLPLSLRTPPVPVDDYVAIILAERWLEQ